MNNWGRRKEKKKRIGLKKRSKNSSKKDLEEGAEEIRKDYFLNYYLKRTEVHKVIGILNEKISKEKPTNEMEEVRKKVVGTINTIKEVVGRRNKEKRKKKKKTKKKKIAFP